MKKLLFIISLFIIFAVSATAETKWIEATELGILGNHSPKSYQRFPEYFYPKLQKENLMNVYWLSYNSAGMHIDFATNATELSIKYELYSTDFMPHMPLTGSMGADTYIKYKGKWHHFDTIYPSKTNVNNEKKVFVKKDAVTLKNEEFITFSINFPLYNSLKNFYIGVNSDAEVKPLDYGDKKPVIIYGTSITQGGCASRPGTCYSNILRRNIDRDVYNLGFSGSGLLEHTLADYLCTTDPEIMIIDSFANMFGLSFDEFKERINYFYSGFRKVHPKTPIIFMEHPKYSNYWAILDGEPEQNLWIEEMQKKWSKTDKNVYVIKSKDLYGDDDEATVDNVHATDLGFYRMSKPVIKTVKKLLK